MRSVLVPLLVTQGLIVTNVYLDITGMVVRDVYQWQTHALVIIAAAMELVQVEFVLATADTQEVAVRHTMHATSAETDPTVDLV